MSVDAQRLLRFLECLNKRAQYIDQYIQITGWFAKYAQSGWVGALVIIMLIDASIIYSSLTNTWWIALTVGNFLAVPFINAVYNATVAYMVIDGKINSAIRSHIALISIAVVTGALLTGLSIYSLTTSLVRGTAGIILTASLVFNTIATLLDVRFAVCGFRKLRELRRIASVISKENSVDCGEDTIRNSETIIRELEELKKILERNRLP